ncbi:hypothetical protein ACFWPA_16685 [Rhodococcus sp. NPDC058505]|uniref:hypothetical protein n=1 Tax=Rhodococcus sp. NPDC058505 TaxID=3346531 RepID=UPI00366382F0
MGEQFIRREEALRRGATDRELQRQCRTGVWKRLHPGRFAHAEAYLELGAEARHRLVAEAVLDVASPEAVLSHQSAAVVHGFDLWSTPLARVHLTRNRSSGGSLSRRRRVHSVPLPDSDITTVDGLRVTTPARTVVDLAATLGFEQALVAADHALHVGAVDQAALEAALTPARKHPHRIRRVLRMADGRSESVGETRSRALLVREQLPLPDLQPELHSHKGVLLGRVDFLFNGVVGEFDGLSKYGRLVPDGTLPEDVLVAEKKREDAIRDAGWQVVRWTWEELTTPEVIADRIRRALNRARRSEPPTGRIVRMPPVG